MNSKINEMDKINKMDKIDRANLELDKECPICTGDMDETTNNVKLSCKHQFHIDCLMISIQTTSCVKKCPYCRKKIRQIPWKKHTIPQEGLHNIYKNIKGVHLSLDDMSKYLIADLTRCCMMKAIKQNDKEKKIIYLNKKSTQCLRKKDENSNCCKQHNLPLEDYKFVFP